MDVSLRTRVNLYRFTPGRRAFVLRELSRRATGFGLTALATRADEASAHDQEVLAMQARRRGQNGGVYGPEAAEIDNLVDRGLTGYHAYLDAQARLFVDQPQGEAGERLRDHLFPAGPGAITRLPYPQQHSEITRIIAAHEDDELQADVAALPELPAMLARLRELNDLYGQMLHDYDIAPGVDEIRLADEAGQENLAEVYLLVLAHGLSDGEDAARQREHLCEPIERQNEAIRLARRRRRQPREVDPDLGDELPDIDDPGGEPSDPTAPEPTPPAPAG
ncbi:hypothetical protein [Haliangium sp.]|uniref:hypothetical protein n=1 Tax=Haliangium sp. TaxID=2663208 RepID=UPI003D0AC6D8